MLLRQIFDPYLAQYAYLIGCQKTGDAVIIDPLRDIDSYQQLAKDNDLRIVAVAETHIHADFVSGGREFAQDPDIHLYLSAEGGADWTYQWPANRPKVTLLKHGDSFHIGKIELQAIHTPGHTPEHISYLITDHGGGADSPIALATGDFLFVGDVGRPDLLETAAGQTGSMRPAAERLEGSIRNRLADFSEFLQILPGHGAGSACGKSLGAVPTSTLGYERRYNKALKLVSDKTGKFVDFILSGQPEPPPYFARMKQVNRDGIAVTGGLPKPQRVSAASLQGSGAVIIDARSSAAEFVAGHVAGALFAPLRSPYFSVVAGSYIEPEQQILLVLEQEQDLDLALRQLYRIGYDHVIGWISLQELKAAGLLSRKIQTVDFADWNSESLPEDSAILDVRTSAEFSEGHLSGALHVPYTRLRLRLDDLPSKEWTYYIHCGTGRRASLSAAYLQSLGYKVVFVDGICEECERIAESAEVLH